MQTKSPVPASFVYKPKTIILILMYLYQSLHTYIDNHPAYTFIDYSIEYMASP